MNTEKMYNVLKLYSWRQMNDKRPVLKKQGPVFYTLFQSVMGLGFYAQPDGGIRRRV